MPNNNRLTCPKCNAWTTVSESRIQTPLVRRRRYECANGHRFITVSTEAIVSIMDDSGKYVKVNGESK